MRIWGHVAAVAFSFAAMASVAQADTCSRPSIASASTGLEAARAGLLALPPVEDSETAVPPKTRMAIAELKTRLGAFVATVLRCQKVDADAAAITAELTRLAHATKGAPLPNPTYGQELSFDVRRFAHNRLGVTAQFDIECGSDLVLSVFAPRGGVWREALRVQSPPYKTVGGGLWAFDYTLSEPDESGRWYTAIKSVAPWCVSTWSEIRYAAYRATSVPLHPKTLVSGKDSIWWGNDDLGRIRVGKSDLEIRFHAESIDGAVHNREWIRHYAVTGDTVRRIPPLADSARDFADEWTVLAWKDAAPWTERRSLARLQRLHATLHKDRFEFNSVRSCTGAPNRTQIEVGDDPDHYYLQVLGSGGAFTMLDVARQPDPSCTGANQFTLN